MNPKSLNEQQTDSQKSIFDLINSLKNWLHYMLANWLIILLCGIIGGVLGLGYSVFRKTIYNAELTFVLEDGGGTSSALGQYAGLASMVGLDLGGGGGLFQGDNILLLYKSRYMIEKTLLTKASFDGKSELLIDKYIQFNNLRDKWKDQPGLSDIDFSDSTKFTLKNDSIIGTIVKNIRINDLDVSKIDKKLSIIKVTFKSENELFAKAFTNELVSNVNRFYVYTKTRKSLENVSILQHQTDSVRNVMNGFITSAATTLDATPNLNPTRTLLRAPVQRSQFGADANKAILGELVKNLEISKVSLRKEMPLIQVIDRPVLPLEKDRLGKFKGVLIGGIFGGVFILVYLSFKRFLKSNQYQPRFEC